MARNCWPKVASISEAHCTMSFLFLIWLCICNHICIEIIIYSQNIIFHDVQLNRGLQALRNNDDTDM